MSKIKVAAKCRYKPTEKELWQLSCLAVQLKELFPKVYQFINTHTDCPAPVLIEALKGIAKYKPEEPWGYGEKIVREQTKNFNAEKNIEEGEKFKKMSLKPFKDALKEILEKL